MTYELYIKDCDEKGYPKLNQCPTCMIMIPQANLNLHTRRCGNKFRRKSIA